MAPSAASKIESPIPAKKRRPRRISRAGKAGLAEALILSDSELASAKEMLTRHRGLRFGLIPTTAEAAKALTKFRTQGSYIRISAPNAGRITEVDTQGDAFKPPRSAFEPDAKAQVLARGLKQKQQDLRAGGGTFDLDEVRELMHGVTSQAVGKRVREGSILAVPGPSNRRRYPTAQFMDDGAVVPGLKAVVKAFPSASPWMLLNFLVNPDSHLDQRKPIDVLKAGQVDLVVESARRIGQQGA